MIGSFEVYQISKKIVNRYSHEDGELNTFIDCILPKLKLKILMLYVTI